MLTLLLPTTPHIPPTVGHLAFQCRNSMAFNGQVHLDVSSTSSEDSDASEQEEAALFGRESERDREGLKDGGRDRDDA